MREKQKRTHAIAWGVQRTITPSPPQHRAGGPEQALPCPADGGIRRSCRTASHVPRPRGLHAARSRGPARPRPSGRSARTPRRSRRRLGAAGNRSSRRAHGAGRAPGEAPQKRIRVNKRLGGPPLCRPQPSQEPLLPGRVPDQIGRAHV